MNHKAIFQLSPVAAALAIALAAPLAHAAAPASGSLPGAFYTDNAGATYTSPAANQGQISITGQYGVVQWGGTSANVTTAITAPATGISTVAGFNIGANATLGVDAATPNGAVLLSDITTNASQIFGTLQSTNATALFIANGNGVIVGNSANIQTPAGLAILGYQPNQSSFTTDAGKVTIAGSSQTNNGAVTVQTGATINAGYMVVAGNGAVNVGATPGLASATGGTYVAAGAGVDLDTAAVPTLGATFNTAATVEFLATPTTLGIQQIVAGGNLTIDGNSHVLLNASTTSGNVIGGDLLNHGDLILTDNANNATTAPASSLSLTAQGQFASDGGIYDNDSGIGGSLSLASATSNVLLGGVIRGSQNSVAVSASTVNISALNGSVIFDAALTAATSANIVNLFAANQVGIGVQSDLMTAAGVNQGVGSITAPNASVNLVTSNTVAKVNPALSSGLGVVIGNQGSVSASAVNVGNATAAGNAGSSLFNGNVSASTGFFYTGDSFYQGTGATISTPFAGFAYTGDLTGGVSGWTQSTDLYKNAVVINAPAGGTGVQLNPLQLGTNRQNTNLLINGSASIQANLPAVITPVSQGTSITVNNAFKPSNLFVRTAGGNMTLTPNDGLSNFYWPGALYLSTVAPGMLAQVAPIVGGGSISVAGTATGSISNAVPMNLGPGYGVFLMTNSAPGITTLVTNPGSNVNVTTTGRPSFTNVVSTGGTATAYNATQTGNVLVFGNELTSAQVVDYTANVPNE